MPLIHLIEVYDYKGVIGYLNGGGPLLVVDLQHLPDEANETLAGGVQYGLLELRIALFDFVEDLLARVALEGVVPVQHLEQDHAQGPDVHRRVRRRE
mgnify:CR=1 FL=1